MNRTLPVSLLTTPADVATRLGLPAPQPARGAPITLPAGDYAAIALIADRRGMSVAEYIGNVLRAHCRAVKEAEA